MIKVVYATAICAFAFCIPKAHADPSCEQFTAAFEAAKDRYMEYRGPMLDDKTFGTGYQASRTLSGFRSCYVEIQSGAFDNREIVAVYWCGRYDASIQDYNKLVSRFEFCTGVTPKETYDDSYERGSLYDVSEHELEVAIEYLKSSRTAVKIEFMPYGSIW